MGKRGPGYPAFGLKEAVQRVKELYQQDGAAQTTPEVAVRAWGYGSLNGASLRVLAALKQYGLLEGAGDTLRLTDRSLAIIHPQSEEERSSAIFAAANEPPVFGVIMSEYEGKLPSDGAIVSFLVRKLGFQDAAAQKLVESLRETIELVEETSGGYISQGEKVERGTTDVARNLSVVTGDDVRRQGAPRATQGPGKGDMTLSFIYLLAADQVATVGFVRQPTKAEIGTLKEYLSIMERNVPLGETASTAADQSSPSV